MDRRSEGGMTSYERRKRDIAYWKQRGNELELIVEALTKQIKELGARPEFPLISLKGDSFLTDINTGYL
jgi:hypothetical protein